VISDLVSGQFNNLVRVVAFNTGERWAEDASEDIAREIMRRLDLAGDEMPSSLEGLLNNTLAGNGSLPCGSPKRGTVAWGRKFFEPTTAYCGL
jgi:hypothetical protein